MIFNIDRRTGTIALAFVLTAWGCGDGTGPVTNSADVSIYMAGSPYEEQSIAIGETVDLTARVTDADGNVLDNEIVQWSSDTPGIVSVTAGGTVTGLAEGSGRVIASHQLGSDTAAFTVSAPVTGELSCEASDEIAFSIGQTVVLQNGEATLACLPGTDAGASYLLTTVNASSTASATLNTRIEVAGLTSGDGPSSAVVPSIGAPRLRPDDAFHHWMREEVSDRLRSRLLTAGDASFTTVNAAAVGVGDLVDFNVESTSGNGCTSPDLRTARIRAESRYAIVAADTANPSGGYETSDYEGFAEFFDDHVWPLVTSTFGEPSDIDSNSKVFLLFTRGVNERPENRSAGSGIYVGGFFFNRDLFPKTGSGACAGSNEREMFYLLVPDPNGEVSGRKFSREFVNTSTRGVLVHEFQHLVNDSRRLHVNRAPDWEETWLNEGLSHISEELMFYRLTGLTPGLNLGDAVLEDAAVREAFGLFQLNNLERLANFLRQPNTNSLMGADVLATRGAAWHFLRYAADRRGAEPAIWRDLVATADKSGLENLQEALGTDPLPWIRDWAGAVALDDLGPVAAEYTVSSWNLRSLYLALTNYWPGSHFEIYPLRVESLNRSDDIPLAIRGGSAAYTSADVPAGGRAAVRVTVGGLKAPPRLKLLITRTN